MKRMLLGLLLVGCGGDGDSDRPAADASIDAVSPDAKLVDAAPGALALTSTAFVEGGKIPMKYGCDGQKLSPPLAWNSGPSGTKSYALVILDPDANNYKHWVIYDIPTSTTSLPENVDKAYEPANVVGAHQTPNQSNSVGYAPPCPPNGSHKYVFTLTALDVEALPGASKTTTAAQAIAAIEQHKLASVALTGTYAQQ